MMTIEEKINILPQEVRGEVNDFVDFLIERLNKKDHTWAMKLSEKSLDKIWNNSEDDIYHELLKR